MIAETKVKRRKMTSMTAKTAMIIIHHGMMKSEWSDPEGSSEEPSTVRRSPAGAVSMIVLASSLGLPSYSSTSSKSMPFLVWVLMKFS